MLTLPQLTTVAVLGDWHGNPTWAKRMIRTLVETERPDLLLHVGDFGFWPEDNPESYQRDYLAMLEEELAAAGVELWFIDGNHEHFPYLYSFPVQKDGRRRISAHLYHLPRGFGALLGGKKFVALGGAYSIDREHRVEGVTWFEEELITEADLALALAQETADVLLTHEAPRLPHSNFTKTDAISAEQRDRVAKAMSVLEPAYLVHGHHHIAYQESLLTTEVIGLSCDNRAVDSNYIIFDIPGI
jgi:predicted phosphodiesterase